MSHDARQDTLPHEDHPLWDRLAVLSQLAWPTKSGDNPSRRLQDALRQLKELLPFDAATVYFFDPKSEQLVEGVCLDDQVELIDFLNIGAGSGLSGWTVHERRSLLISKRDVRDADGAAARYQTFLSIPILLGERIYGALNLGCHEAEALGPQDVKLAELAATQLANLIKSCEDEAALSQLEKRLASTKDDLRQAHRGLDALEQIAKAASTAREAIHQINDPLSVVIGNVQCLVAEKGAVNQKALSRMRRIEQASLKISEVSRSLLSIHELDPNPTGEDDHVTKAIC